jgi:hypothetical protein
MRRLSEICGEEALDFLANIVEEVAIICEDETFVGLARSKDKMGMVKCLLKDHKREILNVLAYLNDADPEDYKPSVIEIPKMLIELFNDPDFASLFFSQDTVTSSGSVTENTEETEIE